MKITTIKKQQYITSNWSGGTTSQIAIYPSNSTVSNQDFIYRISSAIVNVDSNFTKYNGYTRYITTLDNSIILNDTNLNVLEVHKFSGDDNTSSIGKCTDFNLICRNEYECNMQVVENDYEIDTTNFNTFIIFSPFNSEIIINETKLYIEKYDSIVIEDCSEKLQCNFSSKVIIAMIKI